MQAPPGRSDTQRGRPIGGDPHPADRAAGCLGQTATPIFVEGRHFEAFVDGSQRPISCRGTGRCRGSRSSAPSPPPEGRPVFAPLGAGARSPASFSNDRSSDRPLNIGFATADLHHRAGKAPHQDPPHASVRAESTRPRFPAGPSRKSNGALFPVAQIPVRPRRELAELRIERSAQSGARSCRRPKAAAISLQTPAEQGTLVQRPVRSRLPAPPFILTNRGSLRRWRAMLHACGICGSRAMRSATA